jgi:pyruvate dehydrogenase E2 component (dihydrolipoyllysine-residue acetyltransferase)
MSGKLAAITMPKWGMSMREGLVADWLITEGENVNKGDELVEIETDKITNVMEVPTSGQLCRHITQAGETVPVGALIGLLSDGDVSEAEIEEFVASFEVIAPEGEEDGDGVQTTIMDVDGRNICYLAMGPESDQIPIILIHGFGGDLNNWLFNQAALADNRRVIALDLPGHGSSGKSLASGSLEELALAVAGLMDGLEIDKAHLVGHSLGGAVAAKLAILHTERVASLSLLAPAGLGHPVDQDYLNDFITVSRQRKLRGVLGKLFANPEMVTLDMVEDVVRFKRLDGVPECLRALADNALAVGNAEIPHTDISVPTQVIWGEADGIIAPATSTDHLLANCGHMVHMEAASDVNALIEAFIAG